MGADSTQRRFWALVRRQHGVVTRPQLRALGFSEKAIRHRVARARLTAVWPDVYAVGRPELSREGWFMAAVLTCGSGAVLSHETAAELWGFRAFRRSPIEVSVPSRRDPRRAGIRVHRRRCPPEAETAADVRERLGIPLTGPAQTLIDLAVRLSEAQLHRAIAEADKLDLLTPDDLREAARRAGRQPGAGVVKAMLDRTTFTLTDSELERRFARIALDAGLPRPQTRAEVNGFTVDFYWPDLGLVVETDGLRYHRTPAQQKKDRIRDQIHTAAGLTALRFTHEQVQFEPGYVAGILRRA